MDGLTEVLLADLYGHVRQIETGRAADGTRLTATEKHLTRLDQQMTEAQAKLDTDVAAINEAVGNVVTEIAALKAAVAAGTSLDFTGLDAAVGGLNVSTDVVESTETPAAPPVAP